MREAPLEAAPTPALTWDTASVAPMVPARFAAKVNGQLPAGFTASLDDWLGAADPTQKLPDGSDDPDTNPPVRAHDKIAAVGTGVFTAMNFLQSKPGGYSDLDDATFLYDATGAIVAPSNATTPIWVSFAVPTAPMPASGYPVVILQHGLGDSRTFLLAMANVFAAKGWVTVAIDSVTFGARAPEAVYQIDAVNNFSGAGGVYQGPDGFGDPDANGNTNGSTDFFGLLKNIGAIRDQFREASFDTAQLVKVLRSATLDLSPLQTGATVPMLDPTRIAYVGDFLLLGAIEGATVAAFEPYVKTWVLNVAGGGLFAEMVPHSPTINALARIAAGANFGLIQASAERVAPVRGDGADHRRGGRSARVRVAARASSAHDRGRADPSAQRAPVRGHLRRARAERVRTKRLRAPAASPSRRPTSGRTPSSTTTRTSRTDPWRMPLTEATADASGAFHDTPMAGTTAIVVQHSPAQHGVNMTSSTGARSFGIPYSDWAAPDPFHHLDVGQSFDVRCPYRTAQTTLVQFIDAAFQGNVPSVTVLQPPRARSRRRRGPGRDRSGSREPQREVAAASCCASRSRAPRRRPAGSDDSPHARAAIDSPTRRRRESQALIGMLIKGERRNLEGAWNVLAPRPRNR